MLEDAESYGENEGRNWCEKIRVDQSQSSRELAFPSSGVEEPRSKKKESIHECWPPKRAVLLKKTMHGIQQQHTPRRAHTHRHTPCRGEEGPVDSSEAGQSHKDGYQPGHHAKMVLPETLPARNDAC